MKRDLNSQKDHEKTSEYRSAKQQCHYCIYCEHNLEKKQIGDALMDWFLTFRLLAKLCVFIAEKNDQHTTILIVTL